MKNKIGRILEKINDAKELIEESKKKDYIKDRRDFMAVKVGAYESVLSSIELICRGIEPVKAIHDKSIKTIEFPKFDK